MPAKLFITMLIIVIPIFFANAQNKQHSYVGVKTCAMCHKSEKQGQQLKIWEGSKHATAYETLLTEKADKIAKEKGFKTKASETEDCLKCHASGYNVDASLLGKNFKIEQGVQCETCHGPGSDYKSKKVMQDREKAVANGLLVYEKVEELCISCHNAESPTYVDFKFEESWEKIAHKVPE
jgi:hypothetical protein